MNNGENNNSVYYGVEGDEHTYTGITKQPIDKRLYQHRTTGKPFDSLEERYTNLTRNQARAIEQYHIESGPNLRNKINSISPQNKFYSQAMEWASNQMK